MNVDEVELTEAELNIATAPQGRVLKTTRGGAEILFYERTSEVTDLPGIYTIPVAEQHIAELTSKGSSGYAREDIPFVLSIHLVR